MKNHIRDLLLISKFSEEQEVIEINFLNSLLPSIETMDNFCKVVEVFDLRRYKVINKMQQVADIVVEKKNRPLVFVLNKN